MNFISKALSTHGYTVTQCQVRTMDQSEKKMLEKSVLGKALSRQGVQKE